MRLVGGVCPQGVPSYDGREQRHPVEPDELGVERCILCGQPVEALTAGG